MVTRAATTAEIDAVETSTTSAAAVSGPAAQMQPHPFSAAIAAGESTVRTPFATTENMLAAEGVAMGAVAVAGVVALDQSDSANAVDLSSVEAL
ncbi:hypothetical protein [Mycolicibacterium mageritense]|uniref:hypothetical protein n=1 Tax=Mycolicibacterium mageritense TaxID=53462 RepID=UPI001E514E1D|nr:hypothetical protein [Mycolicibacterium mageritense]GJJ23607.1 hypothetical protein MTY414_72800 [Mycolicibacterium mageritense]